jgi:hypothetical protein
MAKTSTRRVTRIHATTLATFQGTFAALIGLGIAILYSLERTIQVADATDSVLRGMAFGLATGVISIIVLPFIYFAFGWLIGLFQAWIYNAVLGAAGGVVFDLQDE